jgi:hypothetical protein
LLAPRRGRGENKAGAERLRDHGFAAASSKESQSQSHTRIIFASGVDLPFATHRERQSRRTHDVDILSFALLSVASSCPDSEVRGLSCSPYFSGHFAMGKSSSRWSLLLLGVAITCAYL